MGIIVLGGKLFSYKTFYRLAVSVTSTVMEHETKIEYRQKDQKELLEPLYNKVRDNKIKG